MSSLFLEIDSCGINFDHEVPPGAPFLPIPRFWSVIRVSLEMFIHCLPLSTVPVSGGSITDLSYQLIIAVLNHLNY